MNKTEKTLVKVDSSPDSLFERVVAIMERARANYTTYSDRQPEIRQIGFGESGPKRIAEENRAGTAID